MNTVQPKTVKILGLIFALISIFYIFYSSCSYRGLYLDGSVFLMNMLDKISLGESGFFYDMNHPRIMITALVEAPVIIAAKLFDIQSKYTYSLIYSFSSFAFSFLALWWNFELTKRTKQYGIFFWSLFAYTVILLPFHIFIMVETIIGVPLQFILLNYLFGKIHYTKLDKLGIAFIILMMFGIYEHTILIGAIVAFGMFFALSHDDRPSDLLTKVFIGAGSIAATFYTVFFTVFNKSEHEDGLRFLKEMVDFYPISSHLNLVLSYLTIGLLLLILFKKKKLQAKISILFCTIYLYVFVKMVSRLDLFLNPMWEAHARSIACWAVPLIFFGIVLFKVYKKEVSANLISNATIPVLLCGIAMTAWQIIHTYYWNENIAFMRNELAKCSDVLYIPTDHEEEISSFFNKDLRRYIWFGNFASTSVMLTDGHKVKTLLVNPDVQVDEGNITYRENLWAYPEKNVFCMPYNTQLSMANKFWDLTDAAIALNKHNEKYDIKISMPENPDDIANRL